MSIGATYLLDSHALLWWWFDPDRLSTAVRELLGDPATPVLVSAASVWELSLKYHQGKLPEMSGTIADLPGVAAGRWLRGTADLPGPWAAGGRLQPAPPRSI